MPPKSPALRLYAIGTLAGALEPCGCVKDMLGGVDHAAALIQQGGGKKLVVAAGPTFFMDPKLGKAKKQALYKAETLSSALASMKLSALAPGANDWAAGSDRLAKLARGSGAKLLAANLKGKTAEARAAHVVEVGGLKVGIVGASVPLHDGQQPPGVRIGNAMRALFKAKAQLAKQRVQIWVALVAMPRGDALRLAERLAGFDVMVIGKPSDAGETNDEPTPPVVINGVLVVQPPNHLQHVAAIDLFVQGDDFEFEDGSDLVRLEKEASVNKRIQELEARIESWQQQGVKGADLEARQRDLAQLRRTLSELRKPGPPPEGSFFQYELLPVKESVGVDPGIAKQLASYYKKVNEHNRVAFKDREPEPVPKGKPGYTGAVACAECHEEAHTFWKKTGHAGAYRTLSKQHKQFNLECVGCHVTGYEQPGGSTVTHVENLKDVQCEVCHGPGSLHAEAPEAPDLIIAAPPRALCAPACHHPPHVKPDWDVNEAFPHIIGPGHGEPLAESTEKD